MTTEYLASEESEAWWTVYWFVRKAIWTIRLAIRAAEWLYVHPAIGIPVAILVGCVLVIVAIVVWIKPEEGASYDSNDLHPDVAYRDSKGRPVTHEKERPINGNPGVTSHRHKNRAKGKRK